MTVGNVPTPISQLPKAPAVLPGMLIPVVDLTQLKSNQNQTITVEQLVAYIIAAAKAQGL